MSKNVRPGCVDYSKFDAMDFSDDSDDEREREEREERYRVQEEQEARRRREAAGQDDDDSEYDEEDSSYDYDEEDDSYASEYDEDEEDGSYDDDEEEEEDDDDEFVTCALCRVLLTEPSIIYQVGQNRRGNDGLSIAYGDCGHGYHLDCVQRWLSVSKHPPGCCAICSQAWNFASIVRIPDDDLANWRLNGQRQMEEGRSSWVDDQLRKPHPRRVVPDATLSQLKQAWFPDTTVDDKGNVRQNGRDEEDDEEEDRKPSAEGETKTERFCANCHRPSPSYRCSR
jgi:hypothetical protein